MQLDIIGDVHGHADALNAVLRKLGYRDTIMLGDTRVHNRDCGDGGQRRLAIRGGDGGHRLADVAHGAVIRQQRDRGRNAARGQGGRQVERVDVGVRDLGTQDHTLELPRMSDVDRVACRSGDLVARFDARPDNGVAVVAAGAGGGDRPKNVVIGAAAAQVPGKRRADLLTRGDRVAAFRPPPVMEGDGLDDEARRTETALQGVERDERLLHRMQLRCSNALDRRDSLAGCRVRRREAAHHRHPVEQDGAGPAHSAAADELGAGEAEVVARDLDQQCIGVVGKRRCTAVDGCGFRGRSV